MLIFIMHEKQILGVGLIIVDDLGYIALVHRCGKHAQGWSLPGGTIEITDESPEAAVAREAREELGIEIEDPKFNSFVPDHETFMREGIYPYSVIFKVTKYSGKLALTQAELDKGNLDDYAIVDPELFIPTPHVPFSERAISNYLNGLVYEGENENGIYKVYGGPDVTETLHI